VYGLAFHPDGSLAVSAGLDAMARLWDLRTGRSIHVLRGHAKAILSCDFHPNGYHVATAGQDHSVRVWDLRKRACLYNLPAHRHLVSEVSHLPSSSASPFSPSRPSDSCCNI
jgi:U4/U6 small nuclear ribonucleoprotein PRP4